MSARVKLHRKPTWAGSLLPLSAAFASSARCQSVEPDIRKAGPIYKLRNTEGKDLMRQSSSSEGTKIAQAAKDLNVTSVTIRRYLSEFNIETTTDENGVKVLPPSSMDELKEIRRLKEDGLTNPKVMEMLEELRAKQPTSKGKGKERARAQDAQQKSAPRPEEAEAEESLEEKPAARRSAKSAAAASSKAEITAEPEPAGEEAPPLVPDISEAARSKHTLTCQTCGKVFEHMNPRLRDCLDCYRTKRKERRRGGSERHKNVIQHPLAQQVATKSSHQAQQQRQQPQPVPQLQPVAPAAPAPVSQRQPTVRNYRKAIEETRHITASLKRRLERPDLPEGERRWLEQIYAYQLILHQGWRHLADYKSATQQQTKGERGEPSVNPLRD